MIEAALQQMVEAELGIGVYPLRLPHSATLPAILYRRVSGEYATPLDFSAACGASPLMEFSVWSKSYEQAKTIATQLRVLLEASHGTVAGVLVQSATNEDEVDSADEPRDGSDDTTYQVSLAFRVLYKP